MTRPLDHGTAAPAEGGMWAKLRHRWARVRRRAARWGMGTMMFSLCLPPEMCVDHLKSVHAMGMTPLKPPTTINGPGAMVWVRRRGKHNEFIEVGNLCGVRASLGEDFVPLQSPTYRDELSKMISRRFTIGADVLNNIGIDVTFKHISKISVVFENPRIMSLSEADVRANMHKRSQDCKDIIRDRKERGDEVTMVYSTLEGDLVYTVSWELSYDVDVQTKIDIVSQLAAKLGVGQSHITSHSISSPALIWGMTDDVWLAELSIRGSEPRELKRNETRLIPRDARIDLTSPPLAPVVPSQHPDNARYRYETPVPTIHKRAHSLD